MPLLEGSEKELKVTLQPVEIGMMNTNGNPPAITHEGKYCLKEIGYTSVISKSINFLIHNKWFQGGRFRNVLSTWVS